MSQITVKNVAKTAFLPGILPRLKSLTKNGFSSLATFIALLFQMVKILPNSHPFLNPANYGRYGVIDVIVESSRQIKFTRKHIDQLVVFGVIVLGLVLLVLQTILFISSLIFKTAWAQGIVQGLLSTPNPETDIAYSILDMVFGIPGIYGSNFDTINIGGPPPFQAAMHNMFAMYSFAILLLAVLIFLYYFVQTAFETAQSGKPFGQRFDTVWTPIRLVVALGLLVPFSFGLNSAQYIVLYTAKFGSSLATNMWLEFNNTLVLNSGAGETSPLGYQSGDGETITFFRDTVSPDAANVEITINDPDALYRRSMIALPKPPAPDEFARALILVNACMGLYETIQRDVDSDTTELGMYLVSNRPSSADSGKDFIGAPEIFSISYEDALAFYDSEDIIIRFGERNIEKYPDFKGNVAPLCGDIVVPIRDLGRLDPNNPGSPLSPGQEFQKDLFENYVTVFVYRPLDDNAPEIVTSFAEYWAERELDAVKQVDGQKTQIQACNDVNSAITPLAATPEINRNIPCNADLSPDPDAFFYKYVTQTVGFDLGVAYQVLYEAAIGLGNFQGVDVSMSDQVLNLGWGGAGIWYNRIAELNGMMVTSLKAIPRLSRRPLVMEQVRAIREQNQQSNNYFELFNPVIPTEGDTINAFPNDEVRQTIAVALYKLDKLSNDRARSADQGTSTKNILGSIISFFLGTEGLYTIRENVQIHPLAQLTALGRSMIDAAIANLTLSAGTAAIGGFIQIVTESQDGFGLSVASSFFVAMFSIGITLGFVLYYVIPFMPFMFFFFAMISWIKTIFEAMVGVPLWALAHLRFEGEGLVGQAAANGYLLLLDIFIRPALILFGLIAASIIFFTEVYLLHIIYDLIVENLAGADTVCFGFSDQAQAEGCDVPNSFDELGAMWRPQLDMFFYTVFYTIIVYVMANTTFKLIDQIPQGILRWIGGSTSTYSDNAGDPTAGLQRNVSIAGSIFGGQVAQGVSSASGTIGQTAGRGAQSLNLFGRRGGGSG